MSKVIKLQKGRVMQTAPSLATEDFLSFEDFWQIKPGSAEAKKLKKPKSPQEIAMEEAREIIRQAEEQAEKIKDEACSEGLARGEAVGQARYEKQLEELGSLLSSLNSELEKVLSRNEESVLALIKAMVDRLVYHEVSVNPLVIQACLNKAMEFVVENSTVRIHLHGEDVSRLQKAFQDNPRLLENKAELSSLPAQTKLMPFGYKNHIQLVEDPNVDVGGCLLKTDFGEIDATQENCKARLYAAVEQAFHAAMAGTDSRDS